MSLRSHAQHLACENASYSSTNREASEQWSTCLGIFVFSQKCTTCVSSARHQMGGSTLGGSLLDTCPPPHTHKLCVISLCYGSACIAPAAGMISLVSALPLLVALPYWVAGSLGPSSLQHALQGQKTMRQGSASSLCQRCLFLLPIYHFKPKFRKYCTKCRTCDFFISCFSQRITHSRGNIEL